VVECGGDAAAAVTCGRLAHEDGARRSCREEQRRATAAEHEHARTVGVSGQTAESVFFFFLEEQSEEKSVSLLFVNKE
jgi:hypothetical protein